MDGQQYFSITTRQFTLRCSQDKWLRITQELYNEIILFYYALLVDLEEKESGSVSALAGWEILRRLEVLTIKGRDKRDVPYPLPWVKIPLYFRRAAINEAVACGKTYFSKISTGRFAGKTRKFHKGITFYKGMYHNLTEHNVTLKVWNGKTWVWMSCRISGNYIPAYAQTLSPSVFYDVKGSVLLLPVKTAVPDGRKAEERMQQGCRICSIQFTNEDYFAVGVVLDEKGCQQAVKFFRGGGEYSYRCRKILHKINHSEEAMGLQEIKDKNAETDEKYNRKYWMKFKNIRRYYSHLISRQIIDFCTEQNAAVITLPKYDEKYTRFVMQQTEKSSSIHLSNSIREQLFYKAWQGGMVVLEVNAKNTSSSCYKCGSPVKKIKDSYCCLNGHRGNKFINSARNIGVKCLNSFGKRMNLS